jgi:hypothetical protein
MWKKHEALFPMIGFLADQIWMIISSQIKT